eukprot:3849978-Rhodomonas_salina.3
MKVGKREEGCGRERAGPYPHRRGLRGRRGFGGRCIRSARAPRPVVMKRHALGQRRNRCTWSAPKQLHWVTQTDALDRRSAPRKRAH